MSPISCGKPDGYCLRVEFYVLGIIMYQNSQRVSLGGAFTMMGLNFRPFHGPRSSFAVERAPHPGKS